MGIETHKNFGMGMENIPNSNSLKRWYDIWYNKKRLIHIVLIKF